MKAKRGEEKKKRKKKKRKPQKVWKVWNLYGNYMGMDFYGFIWIIGCSISRV